MMIFAFKMMNFALMDDEFWRVRARRMLAAVNFCIKK